MIFLTRVLRFDAYCTSYQGFRTFYLFWLIGLHFILFLDLIMKIVKKVCYIHFNLYQTSPKKIFKKKKNCFHFYFHKLIKERSNIIFEVTYFWKLSWNLCKTDIKIALNNNAFTCYEWQANIYFSPKYISCWKT